MFRYFLAILLFFATVTNIFAGLDNNNAKNPTTPAANDILQVTVIGSRISLTACNARISGVLQTLGQKANIDIFVDQNVLGRVSLTMVDATIEEVLRKLSENTAFVYEYLADKNAYRIVKAATLAGQTPDHSATAPIVSFSQSTNEINAQLLEKENVAGRQPAHLPLQTERDAQGRLLFKPGELLIKFKPNATVNQIAKLHQAVGSKVLKRIDRIRLEKIMLPEGLSEAQAVSFYRSSDIVAVAERHALRYPNLIPNDSFFSDQWNLTRVSAPQAWNVTQGSPTIVIAIIDTGVDYLHPDLADNIWVNTAELNGTTGIDDDPNGGNGYIDDMYGWDFADMDSNPMDTDSSGHGTHVAGIAAARGNNGIGISGMTWNTRIMVLKAQQDGMESLDSFAVVEALYYARDNGARIVNCSFGAETFVQAEYDAINDLRVADILVVCAAGNESADTDLESSRNYPSSYDLPNIIAVAAGNQNDALASFSNFGATTVDLTAPGSDIQSTVPADRYTEASVVSGDDPYPAIGMAFAGQTDENGITGLLFECGKGYPDEFPAGVSGNIALVERGNRDGIDFYFYQKVQNAQQAGATAVIIYNCNPADTENCNVSLDTVGGTLGSSGNWVPVVSISYADGQTLKGLENPTVTVKNRPVIPAESFIEKSGTSMAAPHVAGTAALLLAYDPGLSFVQIKNAILDTVEKFPSLADKTVSGGRLNAQNALCIVHPLKGDLSCDHTIGLEDAVLAFQVLCGMNATACSVCLSSGLDVDGDERVELVEAIYILQSLAGLRD